MLIAAVRGQRDALTTGDRGPCGASACALDEYCSIPKADGCNAASRGSACAAAPDECPLDCPLVCGCDGKPYCNACQAQRAGVSVDEGDGACLAAGCENSVAMSGQCDRYWSCYGKQYGYSCDRIGNIERCLCRYGQEVVDSVDTDDHRCQNVAALCGFPPLPI